ncbi:cell division protein FtsQ/DivIB [Cytobacillus spongiae]|jgi:cell division protein FtsQ|uniref:cell division protein FtsQ/DivIB n=1 Tax=Cytobacillus spongiae TaxID=2901381 RepID=UPI001F3465AE|nr:cell division protein FtsQ/DivIB [Cytobacillus spongiae]UII57321.1 cell division protein FtsQ/DivIB [Cytobacillus spongiae]
MDSGKIISIEDRIPKLKQQRRKKANRRLIFLLLVFFMLIVCVVYFQSPLSHIKQITITGNFVYTTDELVEQMELSSKTSMWKIDEELIMEKLKELPEIKSATVDIQFPNTLLVQVKEYRTIGYLKKETNFLPVLENGQILEQVNNELTLPDNAPVLVSFKEGKSLDAMIVELEKLPEEVLNSISEIKHTPKETDGNHLSLFMNDGFEVSATIRSFSEKMSHYPSIVSQLDPKQKGIIDLEVGSYFKAYETQETEETEGNEETDESEG